MRNPRLLLAGGMLAGALVIEGLLAGLAGAGPQAPPPPGQRALPPNIVQGIPGQAPGQLARGAQTTQEKESQEVTDRVKLPEDRGAKRKIDEARRLVQEEDWAQAVRLLQTILDVKEDVFLKDEQGRWVSVRAEANRILGAMPREGIQFYELQFGAIARAELKRGQAAGDPQVYADIALRYMHTEAGLEAAALLGTYHLDHGRYVVAALCFDRLLQRAGAAEKLSVITLYKAAMAFERAGDLKNRDRAWKTLAQKLDQTDQPLPPALRRMNQDQLRTMLALREIDRPTRNRYDWLLFQGSADRAAQSEGSAPFLVARYMKDLRADPRSSPSGPNATVAGWLDRAVSSKNSQVRPPVSGFHPIAVGEMLVYRSYWGVHAINIKTGDLLWEYVIRGSLGNLVSVDLTGQSIGIWAQQYLTAAPALFYDNSTLGTLSSDGVRVYMVEDIAIPPYPQNMVQLRFGGNQASLPAEVTPWFQHNKLVARDLSDGKLVWEAGTAEADQPYSDTFFLGPPLPLGDKLYVMAEVNGEVRLLCLDPKKGTTTWSQTLCLVERRLIEEPMRRIQAAHLAYADGVLVCPTNSGAILGLDLLTRSLVWAHSYQEGAREMEAPQLDRFGRFQPYYQIPVRQPTWASSAPLIKDGRVLFTAPDGQSVHCVNLRDGTPAWKKKQESDLYLAGVFGGKALLIGRGTIRALNLKDGETAWKMDWRAETASPAGRGAASGNTYFLPMRNTEKLTEKVGEIWLIDIDKGQIQSKIPSPKLDDSRDQERIPGNLIFHDGEVISQSVTSVMAFPQLAAKEREISLRLEKNPKDPEWLAERGELRYHRGDQAGAVADLKAALDNQPPEPIRSKVRLKLYDALANLLERDFAAHEKYLDEFNHLTRILPPAQETAAEKTRRQQEERDRRAKYLGLVAKGREEQGRFQEAFQAYLDFVGLGRQELMSIPGEPGIRALPEVWVQGRIKAVVSRVKPEQTAALQTAFEQQWKQAQAAGSLEALQRFVSVFGTVCDSGRKAQLQLAERLMEERQFVQAELRLLALAEEAQLPFAAQALDALARLHLRMGDLESAARYYGFLDQRYPKIQVRDGKTGAELFQEAETDKRLLPYLEPFRRGRYGDQRIQARSETGNFAEARRTWLEPEGEAPLSLERYRLGIDTYTNPQRARLFDRYTGEERHTFTLRPGLAMPPYYYGRTAETPAARIVPTFRLVGRIMIFAWGQYVYAYDPINRKELWSHNLLGTFDPNAQSMGGMGPRLNNQSGVLELWYPDGFRERIGTLGPAGSHCVCFLVKDEGLVAVDPLTGQKRWVKSDVAMSTLLFGDGEYVFLVNPARSDGSGGKTAAVRAVDGVPVPVHDFYPAFERKQQIVGRKLLIRDPDPEGSLVLRLYDLADGRDVWTKHFSPKAMLASSLEPQLGAVIDPDGKATVFEIETGKEVLQAALDTKPLVESPLVHLLGDRTQIYLLFQQGGQSPAGQKRMATEPSTLPLKSVLVNGPAYAFDRQTGKECWRGDIPFQALIVEQFDDLPILLCSSYQTHMLQNGHKVKSLILAIDKRDGKTVYQEELDGRNLRLHTLKVHPHSGAVECIGEAGPSATPNYKLTFWLESSPTVQGISRPASLAAKMAAAAPDQLKKELLVLETQLRLIDEILAAGGLDEPADWERWGRLRLREDRLRRQWHQLHGEAMARGYEIAFDPVNLDGFDDLANSLGVEIAAEILDLKLCRDHLRGR